MIANEKLKALETINRALGMIEGVMFTTSEAVEGVLATAVSMIDETLNEVFEDGK